MKKIIFILVAFIALTIQAQAQLTITSQDESVTEKVGTIRLSYASLYYNTEDGYFLLVNSSNRFDHDYCVNLGVDKDLATETLNTLISIGENKSNISAKNGNLDLYIYGDSFLGINAIFVKAKGYAGNFSLNVSELKKGKDLIAKHNR